MMSAVIWVMGGAVGGLFALVVYLVVNWEIQERRYNRWEKEREMRM